MQHIIRRAAVVVAFALLAGACGGDSEVGGGLKADGSSGNSGAIGQATTTAAAPITTAAPPAAAVTTTAAKVTRTTAEIPPCQIVYINNDDKGRFFEPAANPEQNEISCTAGRFIRFVNRDDDPRRPSHTLSAEPSNPELTTPPIPFNGKFDARVTRKGTFTVKDNERPYASITVRVI